MTAEEKLFLLFGRNWKQKLKGALSSKNSTPEQESRESDPSQRA